MNNTLLDHVIFRVGIVAGLRSKKLKGKVVGVMITASHNPAADNGVKIIDPQGDMLDSSWESISESIVNAFTVEELEKVVESTIQNQKFDWNSPANVIIGRDTRPSGIRLSNIFNLGAEMLKSNISDFGVVTTPQLHYLVRSMNTIDSDSPYGVPTIEGYYSKLSEAYKNVMCDMPRPASLYIDCANGVGAIAIKGLQKYLSDEILDLRIVNDNFEDQTKLNSNCGADFVKTQQRVPPSINKIASDDKCASLDGDADRLIYYYTDSEGLFHLLDGDKIATLLASFLKDLITLAKVDVSIGVIQTAYANGSSTAYLEQALNVPVTCTPTGVKHLHHAAQRYDIGIYFEANGHGTVLFSSNAVSVIKSEKAQSPAQNDALELLLAVYEISNQTVGDAISDMLLVELVLGKKGWTLEQWDQEYYDLPNRLVRVEVQNRSLFTTTDAETRLVTPEGLQNKIDRIKDKYNKARTFVRPSGTENVVRVYSEAASRAEADALALKVAEELSDY